MSSNPIDQPSSMRSAADTVVSEIQSARQAVAPHQAISDGDTSAGGPVDVVVIGGGIAGFATAARLQAEGLSTQVLEAHCRPGGCAGWFRRRGFSFDVGATTLVDFESEGVGGELLEAIGMAPIEGSPLPGYIAWLPDGEVRLHRDPSDWHEERLSFFGDSAPYRRFWSKLDEIASVFWRACRVGRISLPIRSVQDCLQALSSIGIRGLPLVRYLRWTPLDLVRSCGLEDDTRLLKFLGMLIEDTVHGRVESAPLVNSALGIFIRGAGLMRAHGGMKGFWRQLVGHYRSMGGRLVTRFRVASIVGSLGAFRITSADGTLVLAKQVVSALPIELTARLAPGLVGERLNRSLDKNARSRGGALVAFLGVPEDEVCGQEWTHHQVLRDYGERFGNGNNMFVSVSSPGDHESAPPGHRAVMLSTHCRLAEWENLSSADYQEMKRLRMEELLQGARRVYPHLGDTPVLAEMGTPRSYERFTGRPSGAVGGYKLTLNNSNMHAVPHDIGVPGFHLAGDSTWPGLGTVAGAIGSRIVARNVLRCSH